MRILIQRVKRASVTISGKIKSKIDTGLLILVGIEEADTKEDAEWLAKKSSLIYQSGKTRACNTYVRSLMSLHRTRNWKIRSDRRIWG